MSNKFDFDLNSKIFILKFLFKATKPIKNIMNNYEKKYFFYHDLKFFRKITKFEKINFEINWMGWLLVYCYFF